MGKECPIDTEQSGEEKNRGSLLLRRIAFDVAREIATEVSDEVTDGIRHERVIFRDDLKSLGTTVLRRMQRNFGTKSVFRILAASSFTTGELENSGGWMKPFHQALENTHYARWENLMPMQAARKLALLVICATAYRDLQELFPEVPVNEHQTRREVLTAKAMREGISQTKH